MSLLKLFNKGVRNSSLHNIADDLKLGKRVGIKSAYGEVYEHGDKGLVKIFRNDPERVKTEILVTAKLAGIGPNMYAASSRGNTGIIHMENLRKGPNVLNAYTVAEAGNRYVPTEDIKRVFKKMHDIGIVHGNAHWGNIFIQVIKRNGYLEYRVRPIDFGMAINAGKSLNNKEANNVIRASGTPNIYEYAGKVYEEYGTRRLNSHMLNTLPRNILKSHSLKPNRKPKTLRNLLRSRRK